MNKPQKNERSRQLNIETTASLVHRKWTIYLEKQKGKRREKTVNGKNR